MVSYYISKQRQIQFNDNGNVETTEWSYLIRCNGEFLPEHTYLNGTYKNISEIGEKILLSGLNNLRIV